MKADSLIDLMLQHSTAGTDAQPDSTPSNIGNGYLAESTLRFIDKNYVWTRIENVDQTNEFAPRENPLPPNIEERYFVRIQAYTVGYDREVGHISHLATALGGQYIWNGVPDILKAAYCQHPVGVAIFLRVR